MPIASFFRSAAAPLRHVLAALLAGACAAFAQSPSAADGFDPNVDGNVYALAAQPDGRLVLGGQFATLRPGIGGPASRNNLARVNADGSADTSFDPNTNGPVRALVLQPDGKILVGGDFTTISGVARNRLARLNADGSLDTAFNPNVGGTAAAVNAILLLPDGRIVIGGSFTSVGGVTRNRCARLNAAGAVETGFDPNFNNIVFALALHGGGKILVGGAFTALQPAGTSTPSTRGRLARLNADGTPDSEFDAKANNSVYAIAVQRDGKILFGGAFTSVQPIPTPIAQSRVHLARLQPDGQFDSAFLSSVGGDVNTIAIQPDGSFLVGGVFNSAAAPGTTPSGHNYLVRFTADGSVDPSFAAGVNQAVCALALLPDGRVVAGGYFTRALSTTLTTGVVRNRLARFHANGAVDTTLSLTDSGRPLVTAVQSDGKILIAGTFTNVGGVTRNGLARLNADGTLDTAFNPNVNGRVLALAVQSDGRVLVGGAFTMVGGTTRNYLARLSASGALDTAFDPNPNSQVNAILLQSDGKILVGGAFSGLTPNGAPGAVTRSHFARLNTDGTVDLPFDLNFNNNVLSLALQSDGKLLVGGTFTTVQPNTVTTTTTTANSTASDTASFTTTYNSDGTTTTTTVTVAGGTTTTVKTTTKGGTTYSRYYLARVSSDATIDTTYDPLPNGAVTAIVLQSDGKALLGGGFTSFPIPNVAANATVRTTTRNHIARLNADGTVDSGFDPNANGPVSTLALQSDGKVLLGGTFTTLTPNGADLTKWTQRKYAARVNADGSVDTTFDLDLNERSGNDVTSVRLQSDGKILLCGGFTSLQPVGATARIARSNFVRLLANGTLDTAFNPNAGGGTNATINTFVVQPDGRFLVAGNFSDLGGAVTPNLARFTPEGTIDYTFIHASGADGPINALALRPNAAGITPQLAGFAWLDSTGTALRSGFKPSADIELNGTINAYAFQNDGSLLLGGTFTNLTGASSANLIRLKPDGTLDTSFKPAPNGPVDAIWIQLDGRILIAGGFTSLTPNGGDAVTRNRVARLNLDGTVTGFDPNANAHVSVIRELPNGQILLAGQFTTLQPNSYTTTTTTTATSTANDKASTATVNNADGSVTTTTVTVSGGTTTTTITTAKNATPTTRNYLARLTTDGDIDPNFNPNPGGPLSSAVVQADGKIVFGGQFNTVAPITVTTANSASGDKTATTTVNNSDGTITTTSISVADGKTTTSVTRTYTRNYLARINADGSVDAAFEPNPNAVIYALALQADGKVVVGGEFTKMGTTPRYNLARINTDGGTDAGFDPNANAAVTLLAVQPDGRILVGGRFTTLQPPGTAATTRNGIARLAADGTLDPSFDPAPNGSVANFGGRSDGTVLLVGAFTTLQPGGVMYVGGAFTNLGGSAIRSLAALNADGSTNSGFQPAPNGSVNALLFQADGKLVVGGAFTTISNVTRNRLARYATNGSFDAAFNPDANGTVYALATQPDGKLLIGGAFSSIAGTARLGLARLNADGTLDATFNSSVVGLAGLAVRAIFVQPDGKILVNADGSGFRSRLARLNADGTADATFTAFSSASAAINTVALQTDGRIVFGGDGSVGLQRLNANGTLDTTFAPAPDGAVTAVALQSDGRVLLGGAFRNVGGQPRNALARVAATGPGSQAMAFGSGGNNAALRNIVWSRDGLGPELSSVRFDLSTDLRTWTTLTASATRPAGVRGWQTGVVTVPTDAPFFVRARGLIASGTGTTGLVEYIGQFNLSASATLAGTPGVAIASSTLLDAKTGQALFVQTSSSGAGDLAAAAALGQPAAADPVVPASPSVPVTVVTGGTARLANLSVRARVTPASPIIAGFAISGTTPRSVLLRGVGPSLGVFGVTTPLAQPRLQLFDAAGRLLLENNGWAATPASVADVGAAMARTGAFPFPANSGNDAALVATLAPGTYSIQVLDRGTTGGIALAEIYDADSATTSQLTNVSSRSTVSTGDGAFITGFVIAGNASRELLIRGIGPGLAPFGVTGTLADPVVSVYDAQGRMVVSNDNWGGENATALTTMSAQVSAFPLSVGSTDAALSISLAPGAYTVQISGPSAAATGAALLEVYELP